MKLNREKIIYVSALLLVFAGVFAVYKFYFAEKLARYDQHEELLGKLQKTEANLKSTFGSRDPEEVIQDYRGKVEAWNDAIAARTPFFNDDEWREHQQPSQGESILQFWYGDESRKMVAELWETAQKKYGAQVLQRMPEGFPQSVQNMLGVVYAESWQGRDVKTTDVNKQLQRLSYGISAIEMLMEANAQYITTVRIEERGNAAFIGEGVEYTRLQLSFMMEAQVLVDFLDGLRQSDSFYSVEGMRIAHSYVLARYDPLLVVDMYLLRASQKEDFVSTLTAAGPSAAAVYAEGIGGTLEAGTADASDRGGRRRSGTTTEEELGTGQKVWKWIKRYVFYTN